MSSGHQSSTACPVALLIKLAASKLATDKNLSQEPFSMIMHMKRALVSTAHCQAFGRT
jgi:hypothetical protein